MPETIDFIETPEKETISVNLTKKNIDRLRSIKKNKKTSISSIVEQLLDGPLEKLYNESVK